MGFTVPKSRRFSRESGVATATFASAIAGSPFAACPTMSSTTTTMSPASSSSIAVKASSSPETSTEATLRSLYNRAAKAFLHRDVALTHSLLSSAFSILSPPSSYSDSLDPYRKKWDILRITLETTIYVAPPHVLGNEPRTLPSPLRANLMLSAPALVSQLYHRSVQLFTPAQAVSPNPGFLPAQILLTLVLSALKLSCADGGRTMAEDWLSRRVEVDTTASDEEGYRKVVEIYVLEILPRLEQWGYAREFLAWQRELSPEVKQASRQSSL
ncbi:hypothetical protein PUNSTDRAFT_66832 [Punctularia strigosozonata HHB-11173 SS5]|uniref:uncharacterized protein n=1 Tax=Punctularia strigosozonata (strain HHB-11173) TaxID=741275 RepID=UPI000441822C|nr:uncharacterized protein PUNSTDRAFT_66832 [Punctularia strigosozonata HHB-11173 SS5]EIN09962.1 hypothetical protein PUNSTDRAFT_66832 [Punctularia strigosozonata HHB-11173 SS5]